MGRDELARAQVNPIRREGGEEAGLGGGARNKWNDQFN